MGVFDESKCDCCVCPMQCVLEQLVGIPGLVILTPISTFDSVTINKVKDFIAYTNIGQLPICNITFVSISNVGNPLDIKQPIKKSKGECACCEDPMTNLVNSMKGQLVNISFLSEGFNFTETILEVGEGIVVCRFISSAGDIDVFSTCAITRILPANQQQINNPSRVSRSQRFKI
ncbi:hypothetical protein VQL36_08875 [Chengkuizengella sp. SCS-71B]|uniref:hypothetical protein n=1 Tax=Chengkuizengella sp. SCS-71B TaxID=3115290 RepID=UPI0032C2174A